jgi:hypothetical protein
MATPYLTSDDLIESIKRKISMPISQSLFSEDDILAFANEEMMIAQVPAVLQFNQEYFVTNKDVALEASVSRYSIPERAIGQKFRELFYVDESGNVHEMTRIDSSNRAYFNNSGSNTGNVSQYYIQGNDVILTPNVGSSPTGSILFVYFLRPNQLVLNERAAICEGFQKALAVINASLVAADTFTINDVVLTAVASSPGVNEFEIGVDSATTAANLATAITDTGEATA